MAPTPARPVHHLFGSLKHRHIQDGETNRAVLGELSASIVNQVDPRSLESSLQGDLKSDATSGHGDLENRKKRLFNSSDGEPLACLPSKRHRPSHGSLDDLSPEIAEPARVGAVLLKPSRIRQSFDRLLCREMGASYGFRSHEPTRTIRKCLIVGVEAMSD